MSKDIQFQYFALTKKERAQIKNQNPLCLWMMDLLGARKSTLANVLKSELNYMGKHTNILDEDNLRHGLNSDLGFMKLTEGRADAYTRFEPISLWDMTAGHMTLKETGGEIYSLDEQPLVYNVKQIINPDFNHGATQRYDFL